VAKVETRAGIDCSLRAPLKTTDGDERTKTRSWRHRCGGEGERVVAWNYSLIRQLQSRVGGDFICYCEQFIATNSSARPALKIDGTDSSGISFALNELSSAATLALANNEFEPIVGLRRKYVLAALTEAHMREPPRSSAHQSCAFPGMLLATCFNT